MYYAISVGENVVALCDGLSAAKGVVEEKTTYLRPENSTFTQVMEGAGANERRVWVHRYKSPTRRRMTKSYFKITELSVS